MACNIVIYFTANRYYRASDHKFKFGHGLVSELGYAKEPISASLYISSSEIKGHIDGTC